MNLEPNSHAGNTSSNANDGSELQASIALESEEKRSSPIQHDSDDLVSPSYSTIRT